MNLHRIVYFSLVATSFLVALTQTNSRLVFAELGYSGGNYDDNSAGYSFDPTGYYSPTFEYFDGPETSGKNLGFDTRTLPFSDLNWDAAIVLVENDDIFEQQLTQDGHTYRVTVFRESDGINPPTIMSGFQVHVDNQIALSATNLFLPDELLALYGGAELMSLLLSDGEIIIGGSAADNLYGFSGDDSLRGNYGDDILSGGTGFNYLSGGYGVDTAVYVNDDTDYVLSKNPVFGFVEVLLMSGDSLGLVLDDVEKFEFRNTTLELEELDYWGGTSYAPLSASNPVFRFFNTKTQSYFYSSSDSEAIFLKESSSVDLAADGGSPASTNDERLSFAFQGSTFESAHSYGNSVGVHRLFNTITGAHFYTASEFELKSLYDERNDSYAPFVYEGISFRAYLSDPTIDTAGEEIAVYRFTNKKSGRYFWTSDDSEIVLMSASDSWQNDGIDFYGERLGNQ